MRFAPSAVFLSLAVGIAVLAGSAVCAFAQSPSQSGILVNLGTGLAIQSSPPVGDWSGATGGFYNLIDPHTAQTDPNSHLLFNTTYCASWNPGVLCTVGGSFQAGIAPLVSLNWASNPGCRLNIWGGGHPFLSQEVRSDCDGANPSPNEVFILTPISSPNLFQIQAWDQKSGQFCVAQQGSRNLPMILKPCNQDDESQSWTINTV